MLGQRDAIATVAVKDLARARRFYEEILGLTVSSTEGDEVVTYKSGRTFVNVYVSQYAGTNQATAVTWSVGDSLGDVVRALRAKGVVFEHYDMPNVKRDGDIHVSGDLCVAWFKDPDGNIMNLVNQ